MKKNIVRTGIIIVTASLLLASCKKDSSSPISTTASQLSIGMMADNPMTSLSSNNGSGNGGNNGSVNASGSIIFTSGIANISEFRFEAQKKGVQIEVRSKALTTIDLFAINPAMIGITLDTGTYSQIEIRAELTKSSTSTLPLVVKGNFTTTTGTVVPIEFDLNDNAEIKVEAQNVVVDNKTNLTSVVMVHLNKLLNGISAADISAATQTNGTIIISGSSNSSIYNNILNNLSSCGDDNGFEHHNR